MQEQTGGGGLGKALVPLSGTHKGNQSLIRQFSFSTGTAMNAVCEGEQDVEGWYSDRNCARLEKSQRKC